MGRKAEEALDLLRQLCADIAAIRRMLERELNVRPRSSRDG